MTKITTSEIVIPTETDSVPLFGYELIREILIPGLLGKETSAILYWAGKDLARKFPLQSMNELVEFFQNAGWGHLTITNEAKNELEVELTSILTSKRAQKKDTSTFQLEAGFLAQQIEFQKNVIAECYEHPKKRAKKIIFTIKWDRKDPVD
ncbi:YslB family protein [Robertmurraya sp. Marseille-Q9965]